ncbi:sensor histidine kinase [Sutcliffiella rhizosphaerae]|uniref:histidine kinase n=1 Tax=Sutcliffiella rhizosphaerae TaxID=2880967 RepID=A0ABN8A914_9BACI|nr:sensor histidine kinase [Sutcliffiella rhizosphaerae]CAG9620316.1 hypothetical protein BACCIP111883_01084 [Sutcliffiella rhizosphaerae]
MTNTTLVESLCHLHTNLIEDDIVKIEELSRNLPFMADLNQANVFIDCPTIEGKHAIVVAEAAPTTAKSVYKHPVVGKFAYEAFEPAVFYSLRTGKNMFLNRAITQEGKTVEQSVVPIKGASNRIIGTLIMEKDISEKLQHQDKMKALSKTTETLSEILIGMTENRPIISEVIEEALFFIDPKGKLLYYNPAAINLVSEVCSTDCNVGTDLISYFPCLNPILQNSEDLLVTEVEITNRTFQVKKICLGEKTEGTFIIFRDMTELRQKERELIVKSVAIREIHHRVKNNLQTVASLLRLQMRRGVPEESKVHFVESLNRILSIAHVYEIILSNSSEDDVEVYSLIEKIGNMLVEQPQEDSKAISISYAGPRLTIKSNKAVSVSLIINELIQNCVNHAFQNRSSGNIHVTFYANGLEWNVQVEDDGVGYSESSKPSLGLEVVKMMAEHDLSGHFTIRKTQSGTIAAIGFPMESE